MVSGLSLNDRHFSPVSDTIIHTSFFDNISCMINDEILNKDLLGRGTCLLDEVHFLFPILHTSFVINKEIISESNSFK